MTSRTDIFYCDECSPVIAAVNNASIVNISASHQMNSNEEEEDIDVCGEDGDAVVLSNSQIQESDDDEGTVQPLGRVKTNDLRIFDDEMLDDGDVDVEGDGVLEHVRRVRRILSLDVEGANVPVMVKRTRVASRESDNLFDSGTESERSDISEDKFSAKAATSDCNSLQKSQTIQNLKLKQLENINETRKRNTKFTSLSSSPNENWRTLTKTRRQTMCAEIYMRSFKAEKDVQCHPILLKRKSSLSTIPFVNNTPKDDEAEEDASASFVNTESHSKARTVNDVKNNLKPIVFGASGFNYDILEDEDLLNASCIARRTRRGSLNLTVESKNIISKSNARPRTNSENPSKSSFALQRSRRRSFLQSPYSAPPHQGCRRGSSTELLTSAENKRSRSNSRLGNITMSNKRHKKNSLSDENHQVVDMIHGRRPSRGRSPLSSNLCSLYAFITPKYVKKKEAHKEGICAFIY